MLEKIIRKNRSYRRFNQNREITKHQLLELIDLARLSPSAANLQPLKYIISNDQSKNAIIFEHLAWAGYLKDWPGPAEGERPSAYIIILADTDICKNVDCDHGIAAQSILLGAAEKGLGGCMIGSINREKLQQALQIPDQYRILLVLAIGEPAEKIVIDSADNGDIKYWRDEKQTHHVPKRPLDEIVIKRETT